MIPYSFAINAQLVAIVSLSLSNMGERVFMKYLSDIPI